MKRDDGFYWVTFENHLTIGEYYNNRWQLIGYTCTFKDSQFTYISKTKISDPQ